MYPADLIFQDAMFERSGYQFYKDRMQTGREDTRGEALVPNREAADSINFDHR